MNEPLRNLMKEEIEEAKREAEEKARVRVLKMMTRKFLAQGQSVDYIAEFIEVDVETVEKWLEEAREAEEQINGNSRPDDKTL